MSDTFQSELSVKEGASPVVYLLVSEKVGGNAVAKAAIDRATVHLYRFYNDELTTINDREHQDVLDDNDGEYFDTLQTVTDKNGNDVQYNFRFSMRPKDNPFLGDDTAKHQVEAHIAHFRFFFDSETKSQGHEVKLLVTNFRGFTPEIAT